MVPLLKSHRMQQITRAGPSVSTMTIELKTIDASNPIDDTMSFTSLTSIGIVRSVVSTTLSEPQYVDKLGNLFRYQLNRPSGTSGWEKLVREGFRYFDQGTQVVVNQLGSDIATPVDHYQYETEQNDKKREIYILKRGTSHASCKK